MMTTKVFQRVLATLLVVAAIFLANGVAQANNDAEIYFNRGYNYHSSGQYELAIQNYNKAIQLNPNNSVYYKRRAYSYFELKKYEQAIKDFDKAIKISTWPDYYNNRGEAYAK